MACHLSWQNLGGLGINSDRTCQNSPKHKCLVSLAQKESLMLSGVRAFVHPLAERLDCIGGALGFRRALVEHYCFKGVIFNQNSAYLSGLQHQFQLFWNKSKWKIVFNGTLFFKQV